MIYIAICDDNEKTVEILKKKVMEFLKKSNEFADITVYTQSENLQYDIQEGKYYDLILSDIEMPNIDGMNLAAYVKRLFTGSANHIYYITFKICRRCI